MTAKVRMLRCLVLAMPLVIVVVTIVLIAVVTH